MKKNIFLFITIIFIVIYSFTFTNAKKIATNSFNTVGPYSNSTECEKIRSENSNNSGTDYQKYERSKCYLNNGRYQYNICKKGEGCINSNSISSGENTIQSTSQIIKTRNPYGNYIINLRGKKTNLETAFGKKVKIIIQRVKGKYSKKDSVVRLQKLKNKLTTLSRKEKYKNNSLVKNLINYINFDISYEIDKLKKEILKDDEENGLDDFICELEGGCEKPECPMIKFVPKPGCTVIKVIDKNGCSIPKNNCSNSNFRFLGLSNNYNDISFKYYYSQKTSNIQFGYRESNSKHYTTFYNLSRNIKLAGDTKYKIIPGKRYYFFIKDKTGKTWESGTFVAKSKPGICTREYRPVCAQPKMPTCPKGVMCKMVMPKIKTYSNSCTAKSAGAKFLYNGKCGEKKDFSFGGINNEYKYISLSYKYFTNKTTDSREVLFRYGYDSKHNYKFTTSKASIELGDKFKYKIVPGKRYSYYFYNPDNRREVLYKGTFVAKSKSVVCTREYRPVCAQPPMPTCPKGAMCKMVMPKVKTYSNSCTAKNAGAKIINKGECKKIVPLACTKWYDGCNTCSTYNGKIGKCTEMACIQSTTPKCLKYSTPNEYIIKGYYNRYLKRNADEDGLKYWIKKVEKGEMTLSGVENSIKNSSEAKKYK